MIKAMETEIFQVSMAFICVMKERDKLIKFVYYRLFSAGFLEKKCNFYKIGNIIIFFND